MLKTCVYWITKSLLSLLVTLVATTITVIILEEYLDRWVPGWATTIIVIVLFFGSLWYQIKSPTIRILVGRGLVVFGLTCLWVPPLMYFAIDTVPVSLLEDTIEGSNLANVVTNTSAGVLISMLSAMLIVYLGIGTAVLAIVCLTVAWLLLRRNGGQTVNPETELRPQA